MKVNYAKIYAKCIDLNCIDHCFSGEYRSPLSPLIEIKFENIETIKMGMFNNKINGFTILLVRLWFEVVTFRYIK